MPSVKVHAFAHKSVDGLNYEPFKQLVMLSLNAGLKGAEVAALAKDAAATGSDDGALKHLAEQRAELRDRIQALALTGVPTPQESKMFRMHLGYIGGFAGREQELLETDPGVFITHVEAIKKAVEVLGRVLEMQK